MAVPTTLHIGRPCMLRAPSRRRGLGGGQARRRAAGWAGRGVVGGWGGREGGGRTTLHYVCCATLHCAAHCTTLRVLCRAARCALHCTVRAALHGAVLCCTLRFACCATLLSAAHRSALCVTCCTAPCVLRCSVQSVARRTAHVCCAPLHCVCWVVPLHTVRAVPHSTAPVAAGSRKPGREGDTLQAARLGRGWCAHAGAGEGHVTGCSPLSWLVRAHGGGRRTRDRQLARVVAGARTPGGRGYTRQARCPGRGRFAHSGAGEELPDGGDAPANALAMATLCTPGQEDGRRTGQRALVVACWRTRGREDGRRTG